MRLEFESFNLGFIDWMIWIGSDEKGWKGHRLGTFLFLPIYFEKNPY